MAMTASPNLSKLSELFRGCMVGALLGDCLGAPFENEYDINGPNKNKLKDFFNGLLEKEGKGEIMPYTDDTVMARAIAQSLIENKTFNALDLAKKFTEDYYQEYKNDRSYGIHVTKVFDDLQRSNYRNVLEPAQLQFNGTGSYGNGAAMRIAPVPLFTFNQDSESTINLAKQTSVITHAHHDGYNAAIVLSFAVKEALRISYSQEELDVDTFLDYLISKMGEVEKTTNKIYKSQLEEMKVALKNDQLTPLDIAKQFGNYVTAPKSVSTSIFAFLKALKPIKDYETDNGYVRTMYYAISIGGDTDTIATMAGAIAGAYYGISKIPNVLYKRCEGINYTMRQADQLLEIVASRDAINASI